MILIVSFCFIYSVIIDKIRKYKLYYKAKNKNLNSLTPLKSHVNLVSSFIAMSISFKYTGDTYNLTFTNQDFMEVINQLGSQINGYLTSTWSWNFPNFVGNNFSTNIPQISQYVHKPFHLLNLEHSTNISSDIHEHRYIARNSNSHWHHILHLALLKYGYLTIFPAGVAVMKFSCNLDSKIDKFSTSLDKFSRLFNSFHDTLRDRFSNITVRMVNNSRITNLIIGSPLYLNVLADVNRYWEIANGVTHHIADVANRILTNYSNPWGTTNHTGALRNFYRFSGLYLLFQTGFSNLTAIEEAMVHIAAMHNIDWEVFTSTFNLPYLFNEYSGLYMTRLTDVAREWRLRMDGFRRWPTLDINTLTELAIDLFKAGELDNNDNIIEFLRIFSLYTEENLNFIVNLLNSINVYRR